MTHVDDNEIFMSYNANIFQVIEIQPNLFFWDVINIVANQGGN